MEVTLPCSLNGLAIIEPLQLSKEVDGPMIYFIEIAKIYFWVILNNLLQLFLIAQIYKVDLNAKDNVCVEHLTGLAFVCAFIFESTIFSELRHTCSMATLLYNVEGTPEGHTLLSSSKHEGGGAVMVEEKTGALSRGMSKFRKVPPAEMPQWTFKNMTTPFKLLCYVVVILPKLFIGLWLGFAGGIYIVHSGATEDMVLNTLAVNFIADLDEMLYETFTPDATKTSLEHAEGVELQLGNRERLGQWFMNTVIYPFLCLAAAYFFTVKIGGCEHPSLANALADMKLLFHAADAIEH